MGCSERCVRALWSVVFRALVFVLAALPAYAADEGVAVPGGVRYQLIGTYDRERLEKIAGDELKEFMSITTQPDDYLGSFPAPKYAVKLYKITYPSVVPERSNQPTIASGLLAVPDGAASALPMISYQHGTVFDRTYVPSQPENSTETRLMLAGFASQGYIVIGADYFGRGDSDLPDSYLVKASTQQATYDMLLAARSVLSALGTAPTQLFLSGWSQGGWATMAFLQKLENVGEPVTAAAVASGPMDISLLVNRWANNPQPVDAVYLPAALAIQLQAKAYYNEMSHIEDAAIRTDYLAAARDFYAGRIDYWAFAKKTPVKLADFLTDSFRADIAAGRGPYWQLLDASQVYRWRRKTPVRSWYGGVDEVTPVALAELPVLASTLTGGAAFEALDAGAKADHRAVFIRAILDQKPWFDGLLAP